MKTIFLDILVDNKFYRQLKYEYCPLWRINLNDVEAFILSKLPWLKREKFTVGFSSQPL